ncbi:MAG: glycosyltransferase family 4 protein [bacterium]|nr:glycosyltransferase family 4 protein [bacterium]
MSIYLGERGILESKLRALAAFPEIEPLLVTPPADPDLIVPPTAVEHTAVPLVRPISPLRDLRSLVALVRLLRRLRPDVLHTHAAKPGFLGAYAGRIAGVPRVVHTYHGLPFYAGQSPFARRLIRALERRACRKRHHVLSQNRGDIPAISELVGGRPVHHESNGVDVATLREERARHRHAGDAVWGEGEFRLLSISRLEPVKRVHDFVELIRILRSDGRRVSAAVAGPGRLHRSLEKLAADRGVVEHLRFLGWRADVCGLIDSADAVALCSEKEGVPRSLMEAMALGKPVVATDVVGTNELVLDGETGYVTPLGDPSAMARRVASLIEDPQARARMGAAGRQRIEACFDDREIAARWRELYLQLCPRPRG